ncbi:hydrolase, partial [Streptomyces sp. B93]|nr:hydrolase [Streptomyces sp. B93]
TPTPKPTPTPTPQTAALVVSKLAAKEPGRHICYRAFVEGVGWQEVVCDGATAGVVEGDRKIRALNFAVSGTQGTAANAYRHDKGWWQTPWPSAVDGTDLYINTTKKDAPYLLGFAINVGEGAVCANAHVHSQGWHGLKCHEPGGYVFGGTLDNELWLKAVRFTV